MKLWLLVLGLLSHSEFTTFEPEKLSQRPNRLSETWRFMQIMIYQINEDESESCSRFFQHTLLVKILAYFPSVNLCTFCEQKLWFIFTVVNHSLCCCLCFPHLTVSIKRRHLVTFYSNPKCDRVWLTVICVCLKIIFISLFILSAFPASSLF